MEFSTKIPERGAVESQAEQLLRHVRELHAAFRDVNRIMDTMAAGLKKALELEDRVAALERLVGKLDNEAMMHRRIGPPAFVIPEFPPEDLERLRELVEASRHAPTIEPVNLDGHSAP